MDLITVATLGKSHGLRGEFHAFSLTSFAKDRFKKGKHFVLVSPDGKQEKEVTLSSYRGTDNALILGFAEITVIEEAALYRGWAVKMNKEDAPLPKDVYRYADLIGCKAIDDQGNELGTIETVTTYAPTANLKIAREGGKPFYVPFKNAFVGDIDLEKKTVVIHVCEGML